MSYDIIGLLITMVVLVIAELIYFKFFNKYRFVDMVVYFCIFVLVIAMSAFVMVKIFNPF